MKRVTLLYCLFVLIIGCSSQASNQEEAMVPASENGIIADLKKVYDIDTIIEKVNINGEFVAVGLFLNKYDEEGVSYNDSIKYPIDNEGQGRPNIPYSLFVLKSDSSYHIKEFGTGIMDLGYTCYRFFKSQNQSIDEPGALFFSTLTSYGGSGTIENVYLFKNFKDSIALLELFSASGELQNVMYHKNDKEFILFSGHWDEGDGHFGAHFYDIYHYKMVNDSIDKKLIGTTKRKYQLYNDIDGLKHEIKLIEKTESLLKTDDLKEFSIIENDFKCFKENMPISLFLRP